MLFGFQWSCSAFQAPGLRIQGVRIPNVTSRKLFMPTGSLNRQWGSRVSDVTQSLEQAFPKASDHADPHQLTAPDTHIASFTQGHGRSQCSIPVMRRMWKRSKLPSKHWSKNNDKRNADLKPASFTPSYCAHLDYISIFYIFTILYNIW